MNKTRRNWSVKYSCCKGKRDSLTAFYSLASAVFIIAVSFYGAVYCVGSKYPVTDILDDREIDRNEPTTNFQGPSATTTSKTGPKTLIINDDDDDEDGDDQMLTGSFSKQTTTNPDLIVLDN